MTPQFGRVEPNTPTLDAALVAMLNASQHVRDMVDGQIFPLAAENEHAPIIFYEVSDGEDAFTRSGYTGLITRRVTFNCIGRTYSQAVALSIAVQDAIPLFGGAWEGIDVRLAKREGGRDYLANDAGRVTPIGRQLDYTFTFTLAEQPAP